MQNTNSQHGLATSAATTRHGLLSASRVALAKARARVSASSVVTLKQIQAYVDEVARRFQPDKIILFGSHAHGRPSADSDVDLLVVMPHTRRAPVQAAAIKTAIRAPFAVDLIVRSPQRFRQRVEAGDGFLREVAERGRVLHER
ncbi:MAG: nucleotidyltransferase domain-containing protein [Opitutus sp.]|nr:nucleotidyltransferase domain-containing protein [Opitutus sp.]